MIPNTAARRLESHGLNGASNFTIQASSKAFQILSKQLYTDQILAVVRELLCNAWDAHVRAGTTDTPILVHLPSSMDTEFRVKDFGTGISHAGMHSLYATYFGSDKNLTNDEIGGLGLGSKSPFSYTDQFTVRSRFGGVERVYQAYITEDGTPALADIAGPHPATEPDGLEVIVPTKNDDGYAFARRFREYARYLPVAPDAGANHPIEPLAKPLTTLEINGITVTLETDNDDLVIVMGNVPYTISHAQRGSMGDRFRWNGLKLYAPIGTFEVSPSRETLSLGTKDFARLVNLREEIDVQLTKIAGDLMAAAPQANALEVSQSWNDMRKHPLFHRATLTYNWGKYVLPGALHGNLLQVPQPEAVGLRAFMWERIRRHSKLRPVNGSHTFLAVRDATIMRPVHILWAEKKAPYKHMIDEDLLVERDLVWVLHGPKAECVEWLAAYGLDGDMVELTRPPRAAPGQRKTTPGGKKEYSVELWGADRERNWNTTHTVERFMADADEYILVYGPAPSSAVMERMTGGKAVAFIHNVYESHTKVVEYLQKHCLSVEDYLKAHLDVDALVEYSALHAVRDTLYQSRYEWPDDVFNALDRDRSSALVEPVATLIDRYRTIEDWRRLSNNHVYVNHQNSIVPADFNARVRAETGAIRAFLECTKTMLEGLKTTHPELWNVGSYGRIPTPILIAYLEKSQ